MVGVIDLSEYTSGAAFAIDRSMTIVGWNSAARVCLGYAADEVVGLRCSDVLQIVHAHGEPVCVPSCEGIRCFRRHQGFIASSCYARHRDGEWVPVDLASAVMSPHAPEPDTPPVLAVIFLHGDHEHQDTRPVTRTLQIFAFGHFGLAAGGRGLTTEKWERKQAVTLLKILVSRLGRAVPSEVLSAILWPEADEHSGRERLKVTVYTLRRELRAAGMSEDVVETVGDGYLLRREAVWVDVSAYERCVAQGADHQRHERWDDALHSYGEAQRLYRGDYMEENIHADWCAEEHYRLHEVHLEMRVDMAECYAACNRFAEAASICRTILVTDPCRESIHRALMEYLVRSGHTDSAIAQYRHCQEILAEEIGVDPMPETERLYRQIITGEATTAFTKTNMRALKFARSRRH